MMSMIFSRLMSMGLHILMGLGVLAYMIWSWGPAIRIGNAAPLRSMAARAILIIIIFAIWGLIKLFKAWRHKRKNTEISNDLAASADSVDPSEEQSAEELPH